MPKNTEIVPSAGSRSLQVRAMKAQDISALVEIDAESNPTCWTAESFERELSLPHSVSLVSAAGSAIVGFAVGWIVTDTLQILQLAVTPAFRRLGVGKMLVQTILDRAQQQNCAKAQLELRSRNDAALKFYQQSGFYKSGLRKNFYPDDDAVLMEIKLK